MHYYIFIAGLIFSNFSTAQQISTDTLKPVAVNNCTGIKDQYLSGTCWSFAGNSFLESELLRKGVSDIDISEMFTVLNAWEQKILLHLQYRGQNHLTPGGQFHNIVWALKKYGIIPETVYNGRPRGEVNHNHAALDTALTRYITGMAHKGKKAPDMEDWKYINTQLETYLGKPVKTFEVNGVRYTPQSYLKSLPINMDDYLEITSYTHHPFYTPFVFENKYNYSYDKYMNVPLEDFMAITDSALGKGYTVLWNGDVTDGDFNFEKGIAQIHNVMDVAAQRQKSFADSTSYMDHMMHVVGLYTASDGHRWYHIKNSWGNGNKLNGYMLMDENYFKIKTAAIVVNKEAIPVGIRQKMKQ